MKKILNLVKKAVVTGAVVLATMSPAFADEVKVEERISFPTIEDVVIGEDNKIEVEDKVEVEVEVEVEDTNKEEVSKYDFFELELTKEEWNAFVLSQGWDNVKLVTSNGDVMIFEAFRCGVKVADVVLNVVEEDVNYDDQITTLPDDVPVDTDDVPVVLPDDVPVDTTDTPVVLPDDVVVEEDVNYDDQITTLPDDVVVEEDTFEPALDGTENDNMMVEPEVLDGTDNDDIMVTPEVEEVQPEVEEVQPEVQVENVYSNENPQTGDCGLVVEFALIVISLLGLFLTKRRFE